MAIFFLIITKFKVSKVSFTLYGNKIRNHIFNLVERFYQLPVVDRDYFHHE